MENIRDKLAESIHEMWAMGKIEAGWTFGERRDDTMGLHPCLTQFQNLPQVLMSMALMGTIPLKSCIAFEPSFKRQHSSRTFLTYAHHHL